MVGAAYAAVPLYRLFCQVTGFGGTTQRAEAPSDVVLDRTITVRFDANVGAGLAVGLRAGRSARIDVKIGENGARLLPRRPTRSNRPIAGTATFNVTPEQAGAYFNKIAVLLLHRADAGAGRDRWRCR